MEVWCYSCGTGAGTLIVGMFGRNLVTVMIGTVLAVAIGVRTVI